MRAGHRSWNIQTHIDSYAFKKLEPAGHGEKSVSLLLNMSTGDSLAGELVWFSSQEFRCSGLGTAGEEVWKG